MVIITVDDGGRIESYKLTLEEFNKLDTDKMNQFEMTVSFVNEMPFETAEAVMSEWEDELAVLAELNK